MELASEIVGWIGVILGVLVSVPQIIQTVRAKSTRGLSKFSYVLLFLTILCFLLRAIAIKEPVFIVSNAIGLLLTAVVLVLFVVYPNDPKSDLGSVVDKRIER